MPVSSTDVQIRQNGCETYKIRRLCVWSNLLTVTFSVGSPVEVKNRVPASQAQFQQFCVIERFCVEGSNKRSDRGAL